MVAFMSGLVFAWSKIDAKLCSLLPFGPNKKVAPKCDEKVAVDASI